MKYIKIIIVAVLLLATSAVVYARKNVELIEATSADYIYGGAMIDNGMKLIRVVDGKNTCYLITTEVNGNKVNTAISCIK